MKRSRKNKNYANLEQVGGRGMKGKGRWRSRLGGEVELGVICLTMKADVFVKNIVTGEGYR